MNIHFNVYSQSNPEDKVKDVFIKQLSLIQVTSNTTKLFSDDAQFLHDIISMNIEIEHIIESHDLDDIINALGKLRIATTIVSKKLKKFQRSTNTATPRNIYLNQLHNAYGVFILELNAIVQHKKIELEKINISDSSFDKLMNEPYVLTPKTSAKTPNNPSEPSFFCCGMIGCVTNEDRYTEDRMRDDRRTVRIRDITGKNEVLDTNDLSRTKTCFRPLRNSHRIFPYSGR